MISVADVGNKEKEEKLRKGLVSLSITNEMLKFYNAKKDGLLKKEHSKLWWEGIQEISRKLNFI